MSPCVKSVWGAASCESVVNSCVREIRKCPPVWSRCEVPLRANLSWIRGVWEIRKWSAVWSRCEVPLRANLLWIRVCQRSVKLMSRCVKSVWGAASCKSVMNSCVREILRSVNILLCEVGVRCRFVRICCEFVCARDPSVAMRWIN